MAKKSLFETFVKNVKREMEEQKYSYRTFSDKTGINKSTLTNILGSGSNPSGSVIEKIARGLGVDIQDLFVDEFYEDQDHADLLENFDQSSEEGKVAILRFAAAEARHSR